ncbi:hypothetical protein F5B22DRAFT_652511 [Xylaria bambusicola]|uniref:uncharacterized protein n=1 Tax=Xylaria bambusicola TaxID=326684 RepID=UPI0020073D2E|nr:uncharacterized protein F5B22DRAFT_652511 [Xylaria bambusicola]KAI0503006.1 hypothetical protein F5B22DRAFT_652511 [Xylaria bambusicola]
MFIPVVGKVADVVGGIGPVLVTGLLGADWFPMLTPEAVVDEVIKEAVILSVAPVVGLARLPLLVMPEFRDVVVSDTFVKVKLPLVGMLLSDILLRDVGWAALFENVVTDSEPVLEVSLMAVLPRLEPDKLLVEAVNDTEDPIKPPLELANLVERLTPGTEVRDVLGNIAVDSGPEPEPPLTEFILVGSKLVTSEVTDILGDLGDVSDSMLEIPVGDIVEPEIPGRLGTVSAVVIFEVTLEAYINVDVTLLFVVVFPRELELDDELVKRCGAEVSNVDNKVPVEICDAKVVGLNGGGDSAAEDMLAPFCEDIELEGPDTCELRELNCMNEMLVPGPKEPGTLPVTGPFAAEVTILSVGKIVLVNVTPDTVIIVVDSDAKPVVGTVA